MLPNRQAQDRLWRDPRDVSVGDGVGELEPVECRVGGEGDFLGEGAEVVGGGGGEDGDGCQDFGLFVCARKRLSVSSPGNREMRWNLARTDPNPQAHPDRDQEYHNLQIHFTLFRVQYCRIYA